ARAADLEPSAVPECVDFDARLDESEIARSESYLRIRTKKFFEESLERSLELDHRDFLVHVKPLKLMELCLVSGVGRLVPVHLAGNDDLERPGIFGDGFHIPDLHGRSVRAEDFPSFSGR